MTRQKSRQVTSNQDGIHESLIETLVKHLNRDYNKPIASHSQSAFGSCCEKISTTERRLIMDSGCGVGMSTVILAKNNPDAWVIGIDQSAHRLAKQTNELPENCLFFQADLVDFWRLALAQRWRLAEHYILYPNPWPKASQYKRRWHAHPVFPTILNLGGDLTLRSNWDLYVLEFATTLDFLSYQASDIEIITPDNYLTPFEKKYSESGQSLYQLKAVLA